MNIPEQETVPSKYLPVLFSLSADRPLMVVSLCSHAVRITLSLSELATILNAQLGVVKLLPPLVIPKLPDV